MRPDPRLVSPGRRAAAILGLLFPLVAFAGSAETDDWPDWVDEQERVRARIAAVNEGELTFLSAADTPVHHHQNHIAITERSLIDGWVTMEQCHLNLDQVPAAQILFRPTASRNLQVIRFRNMDEAFPDGSSVQLRGIRADSEVCLRAESRALHALDQGIYELQNGPFMRRFLDGYYPLHLSMSIVYPASLRLSEHMPEQQPGFVVTRGPGTIAVEALFEGRLQTRFRFRGD